MGPWDLFSSNTFGLDIETTGLDPFRGDKIISIAITDGSRSLALRNNDPKFDGLLFVVLRLLADPNNTFYIHNAKFDLRFLKTALTSGAPIRASILDTMVLARLYKNDEMSYSLDTVAKWYKLEKDKKVDLYIRENKLYRVEIDPTTGAKDRVPDFDRVPDELLLPYNIKDAELCFQIGSYLLEDLAVLQENYLDTLSVKKSIFDVVKIESLVTTALLDMEVAGVGLDERYTQRALHSELSRCERSRDEFKRISGRDFIDSGKSLHEAFKVIPGDNERIGYTEKGNPSFTDEILSNFTSPLAKAVRDHREAHKKARTYYGNFVRLKGRDGRIHPSFRQSGTATGRLSCADPNLQNVNKEKDLTQEFLVRGCFTPSPGYKWLSIDYQAQEYRMLLDLAEELPVIEAIKGGLDVHTATAEIMGVDRTTAKTINFMLLYGGGAQKLADTLGISLSEAHELKRIYFAKLPMVARFIKGIIAKAERGTISNWYGRVYHFQKDYAYKAPNYVIQGGCADVVKIALSRLHKYLEDKSTRMILQVHDEICFEIAENELAIIPELQTIMTSAYPHAHLPLLTEASMSDKSWALVEKINVSKAGNSI